MANVDVLISGAGPCGLTLAIGLARCGVSVRIIDKSDKPFPGSRGKGIQPRTQEVFFDLGILGNLISAGAAPYPLTRIYTESGYTDQQFAEIRDPSPAEPYGGILMSPQFMTEGVLRAKLAEYKISPEFAHELISFKQDSDIVTAIVKTPTGEENIIKARYLVGADGGRSLIRHMLNIDFPGVSLDAKGLVADMVMEGDLSRDVWHVWKTQPSDGVVLCPLAGTSLFQLQSLSWPSSDEPSIPALNDMIAKYSHRTNLAIKELSWASTYTMSARLADKFRVGRVFLAGDSAHVHPPTGGQGLNTSVQDAYNLSWKLAAVVKGGASETLLDSYEAERRPIAAKMIEMAVRLLNSTKEGDRRRGRDTQQLDLGYPDSALSIQHCSRTGKIGAGNRAPDAPCHKSTKEPITLFQLYQGPHWTLLGFESGRTNVIQPSPCLHIFTVGADGDLVDDNGHIATGYQVTAGEWILVRPDGYLATIVPTQELPNVKSYLVSLGVC